MCIKKSNFATKALKISKGRQPVERSKLDKIIYSIVALQLKNSKPHKLIVDDSKSRKGMMKGQNSSKLQLKIKPDMIIQEMKNDPEFMQISQNDLNQSGANEPSRKRKHTMTDYDLDRITHQSMDADVFKGDMSRQRVKNTGLILAESLEHMPRDLRLDSRINPRKSIVLDISIMDKNQGGSQTVQNRSSHNVYNFKQVPFTHKI